MFDGITFPWWSRPLLPTLTPEYVAGQVVDAIVAGRGRPLVIMPWALRWLPFVLRLVLPVRLLDSCSNLLGRRNDSHGRIQRSQQQLSAMESH